MASRAELDEENGADELEKSSLRARMAKGRELPIKMGWIPGTRLGSGPTEEVDEAALECEYCTFGRAERAGLCTERVTFAATGFEALYSKMLTKTRRSRKMPLATLRAHNFSSEKGSGKPSVGGKRIMHVHDAWGMAWFHGLARRSSPSLRPYWAYGGFSHRCKKTRW